METEVPMENANAAQHRSSSGVLTRPYQICRRCIMDTSDPEIQFNSEGICHHCLRFDERFAAEVPQGQEREARLQALVERIKASGKGKDFDCVVGVSGGVDSTYVAYAAKKLGLRPLAVHFDNGWNSELAVDNIKKTLKTLNIELFTVVVDWEEFRDLQLSFLKAGVANCEIPTDHAITALLFQMADRFGIKYILGGGNVATEGILPLSWGYYSQDLRHLEAIHARFGHRPLKTLPRLGLLRFLYLVLIKKIRLVPILNLLAYDKKKTMDLIQKELGWRPYGGKHYESIWTRFFQGYYLPRKFGYDKRRAHLATLVCSKQMSREAALEEMKKDPYEGHNVEEDRLYVMKKFGLSEAQFEDLMSAPTKSYQDYPSNAFFFVKLQNLKKLFKKIATGAP